VLLVAENPEFAPIVVEGGRDALVIEGIGVGLFRSGEAL
jgi:SOS-response transcriptional repressor LexA